MKPKYDETTLNQLKDIDQDRRFLAFVKKYEHEFNATNQHIRTLKERVDTLEDARERQIEINTELLDRQYTKNAPKPSFFQRFFK